MPRSSVVSVKDPNTGYVANYYLDKRLKKNLDVKVIPSLHKKDKDCVIVVDGTEGSGKSTLAFQIGKYVDPSLDLTRVTFNAEQFRQAIYKAKSYQCVIYDEAFTGLSSRAALSGINRMLISLMMQMRQKNLFVIIVLPTIFLLDKYVALFRTRALIHVYETGGRRGYLKVYNRVLKKKLFLLGKLTYSYVSKKVRCRFRGRFYGVFALGDKSVQAKYKEMKAIALEESEKPTLSLAQQKHMAQRNRLLILLKKISQFSYKKLGELMKENEIGLGEGQVRDICTNFKSEERVMRLARAPVSQTT